MRSNRAVKMAGPRSLGTLIIGVLFTAVYSSPVNIPPQSVPVSLIQSAINSLNANSPTQHTYVGGNLISAQKLLEPGLVIYRLTLNLDTVCSEGATSCPREACAIDLKDRSGDVEVDRNSIQCMYLYPQSAQEDVQQVQQTENAVQDTAQAEGAEKSNNAEQNTSGSENTLELDHEVEAAAGGQRAEPNSPDKPFIAVRAPSSNYCPGCPYELNPNLPGLTAFGVQALDVMDRLGQNDFKHKLIRVIKVTRAVPPGSNAVQYKLLAEIGESNCLKTTLTDRSECPLQSGIPARLCLFTFEERPWQQSDRQVVSNNCTEPSEQENEINAGLNPGLNSQPERVDSVQEVIGKTAHIDQLAQEGKIGTYNSLIDEMIENSAANVTQELNPTEAPIAEEVSPQISRDVPRQIDDAGTAATEAPFVRVEIEREDDRQQVQGFVDKQKEFDEFLADFDIPLRGPGVEVSRDNRPVVTEEVIRPQKVGGPDLAGPVSSSSSSSSEEDSSEESVERGESTGDMRRAKRETNKSSAAEKALIQELAKKAVDTLDDIDQDDNKRIVRRVLEFKRQKSDGFLYHLVMEIALTDCSEENNYETDEDCLDRSIGPAKICKVQIHTDEKDPRLSARVVKSECAKQTRRDKDRRNKRTPGMPGALNAVSTEDKYVKNYTDMGLQKFSETFEGPNEPVLVEILSATMQVVAGSLYKIKAVLGTSNCPKGTKENCELLADGERKECEIKAWSRPWLTEGALEITVKCDENARSKRSLKDELKRRKRTPERVGAQNAISIEDEDVKNYANLGFKKVSETFAGTNEPIMIGIKSATRQVVAGTLYRIIVTVGTSTCPKGTKENCQLLADGERKECEVKVWSRPWLDQGSPEITVNCDGNSRRKRSLKDELKRRRRTPELVGAPNAISIENEDVKNYANLGFKKVSETYAGTSEPFMIGIKSATKQVVAGILYRIIVTVGPSTCPKGTKENCELLADGERKECEVKAWSRPWIDNGSPEITVNCNSNVRSKRGLRGKNYSRNMLEQASYLKKERLFNDFVAKYNKTYSSKLERKNRFKIFTQNMMMVQELQRNEQGTANYGASIFADLTTEEFKKMYLGLRPELRLDNEIPIPMAEIPDIQIPEEYDWRHYNVVTPVKNQGSCGSCWAFSVTGNVEGQYALRHRNLLSFSEQELVDCDTLDQGCGGGLPDNAYRAIEKLGGLELESDYPYDGVNEACHFNKTEAKARVVSAVNITTNETQMAQWLVKNGPISIGINANAMQFYMGGISHPLKFLCSPTNLDHGVLIVGYGIHTYPIFHKRLPYWTIKNSWGPSWGEQGYYRVYRGDGTCGVNQMASSAIVA